MKTIATSIEPLESRIAPAGMATLAVSPDGHTATYTDVDGDHVALKVSAGTLTPGLFTGTTSAGHDQLQLLDLSGGGFDKASLTFSVAKVAGGDGLVNVGYINSTAHDLGAVTVNGDLGQIDAGDATFATPGLKSLTVRSMGRLGTDTQAAGSPSLLSVIVGPFGALKVAGDLKEESIVVQGGLNGTLSSVTIGGSLIGGAADFSGRVFTQGDMGMVKIGHDVQGGAGLQSGYLGSGLGKLAGVSIGGSLIGDGMDSGKITSIGGTGLVKIGGNSIGGKGSGSGSVFSSSKLIGVSIAGTLRGGGGQGSGEIRGDAGVGPVKIGGDVVGGTGDFSGRMVGATIESVTVGGSFIGNSGENCGGVLSSGDLGPVKVGHDVQGAGPDSGTIISNGKMKSVTIGGSLLGGAGDFSGKIGSDGDMGAVKIAHDVQGGLGSNSGFIGSSGKLASVTIGGSLLGGSNTSSGRIGSSGDMGAVKIAHDMQGGSGAFSGFIGTDGKLAGVTIGGSLLGGSNSNTGKIGCVGDIGPVMIAHDLIGGSITGSASLDRSGAIESDGRISSVTIGDSIISGIDNSTGSLIHNATIRAANDLGSLVVKGSLIGNAGDGTPGNLSPVIISARGQAAPLPAGATTDLAIGKISIGGRVEFANILAGYDVSLSAVNGDAQIGAVSVGGDWAASNLVAGAKNAASGNTKFGDGNDASISAGSLNITAKIASVTIAGQLFGTPASVSSTDQFGFVAQQIGTLKIGGNTVAIPANNTPQPVGPSNDVDLHIIP